MSSKAQLQTSPDIRHPASSDITLLVKDVVSELKTTQNPQVKGRKTYRKRGTVQGHLQTRPLNEVSRNQHVLEKALRSAFLNGRYVFFQNRDPQVVEAVQRLLDSVHVQNRDPQVMGTLQRVLDRVPDIVAARKRELTEQNIQALVDVFLADNPVASVEAEIEADNAAARALLLKSVPFLTAQQIHQRSGNKARNESVTASRWKSEKKIFSVPYGGKDLFPAFQFGETEPRPVIAEVLQALPASMSAWQVAFWFMSANGWLGGNAPADCLQDEPKLVAAAKHEAESVIG